MKKKETFQEFFESLERGDVYYYVLKSQHSYRRFPKIYISHGLLGNGRIGVSVISLDEDIFGQRYQLDYLEDDWYPLFRMGEDE